MLLLLNDINRLDYGVVHQNIYREYSLLYTTKMQTTLKWPCLEAVMTGLMAVIFVVDIRTLPLK